MGVLRSHGSSEGRSIVREIVRLLGIDGYLRGFSRTPLVLLCILAFNAAFVAVLHSQVSKLSANPGMLPRANLPTKSDPHLSKFGDSSPLNSIQRRLREWPGDIGLVQFSAYQVSPSEVTAIALSKMEKNEKRKTERCVWEPLIGREIIGILSAWYPGEHHGKEFEIVLLHCMLAESIVAGQGGVLHYQIDGQDLTIFSLDSGSPDWFPPEPPFPKQITYCGSPLYGSLDPTRLLEWAEFHRSTHGIEHFHMYDAGAVVGEVEQALKQFAQQGILDVSDIRSSALYPTWFFSQVMVVNDCVLRTRYTSQWALMMDTDEYLYVSEVPHSLVSFLQSRGHFPWITFGSITHSVDHCRESDGGVRQWAVERMVFHEADVHCRDPPKYPCRELCLKWDGHRKYVLDPRRTVIVQIHRIMNPIKGGLDAHTSLIRLHHFRGLGVFSRPICDHVVNYPAPAPQYLVRDYTIARTALSARRRNPIKP